MQAPSRNDWNRDAHDVSSEILGMNGVDSQRFLDETSENRYSKREGFLLNLSRSVPLS
jgi:hypothetical protein